MRIGGISKQTLIDYPGKIAATIFTQGCNFRCGYCHNPSLVLPHLIKQSQSISDNQLLEWLAKRIDWLDAVVITGGEPTIHKDLPEFIATVKAMGYAIKLDTNGTNPAMLQQLLEDELLDFVAMDIKHLPEMDMYKKVVGIETTGDLMERIHYSVSLLQSASVECQFRTTSIPGIHDDIQLEEIEKWLERPLSKQQYRETETVADHHKQDVF